MQQSAARLIDDSPNVFRVGLTSLTKAEYAYQAVRDRILTGQLAPGSSLDQDALASELNLSTTPLREAVRRLAGENLLSVQAHRRVIVTPLLRAELLEIYQVRIELEPFGAALGATSATAADRAYVWSCLPSPTDDPIERLHLARRFHRSLYGAAGNEVLTQLLDSLADRADRYRMALVDSDAAVHTGTVEHEEMADAFSRGDSEGLRNHFRRHLENYLESIDKRLFGEGPKRPRRTEDIVK